MNCPNCNRSMSCGCQRRVVNGKVGCSSCLAVQASPAKLPAPKAPFPQKPKAPVVNHASWSKSN